MITANQAWMQSGESGPPEVIAKYVDGIDAAIERASLEGRFLISVDNELEHLLRKDGVVEPAYHLGPMVLAVADWYTAAPRCFEFSTDYLGCNHSTLHWGRPVSTVDSEGGHP